MRITLPRFFINIPLTAFFSLLLTLWSFNASHAQPGMPQEAFSKRTAPPKPGYFQQSLAYTMAVTLDTSKHILRGATSIQYTNNSPKALSEVYIHLYPNAFRDHSSAYAREQGPGSDYWTSDKDKRGEIDSLAFTIDGVSAGYQLLADSPDIARISLPKQLLPGATMTIATPFRVKIPYTFSRLGHVKTTYQLTQWYPKPAAFDEEGWHLVPYLDQGEFYAEYATWDVSMTLPAEMRVAGTGNLQNQSEKDWLKALARVGDNAQPRDYTPRVGLKTLRYTLDAAAPAHDFAIFTGPNYRVAQSEVKLPNSARTVQTYVFWLPRKSSILSKTNPWEAATKFVDSSVYFYSKWLGDYPYNICGAIEGPLKAGGGMEYPTVTVIASDMTSAESLDNVIAHEVGHNWFYGQLGSDERTHTWMDEGLNSYYEGRYMRARYPVRGKSPGFNIDLQGSAIIRAIDVINQNQALDLPAHQYTTLGYGIGVYQRTAQVAQHLASSMGMATFDRAMQDYYRRWEFHHPKPNDVINAIGAYSAKDTAWFRQMIQTDRVFDMSIGGIKQKGDSFQVVVCNKGQVWAPIGLFFLDENGKVLDSIRVNAFVSDDEGEASEQGEKAEKEEDDFDELGKGGRKVLMVKAPVGTTKIRLDSDDTTTDLVTQNNTAKTSGLFKKGLPEVKIGAFIAPPYRRRIYIAPSVGFNSSDRLQLGVAISSPMIPAPRMQYYVTPMVGLGTGQLTGVSRASHFWYLRDNSFLRTIELRGSAQRFSVASFRGGANAPNDDAEVQLVHENAIAAVAMEFYHKKGSQEPLHTLEGRLRTQRLRLSGAGTPSDSENLIFQDRLAQFAELEYGYRNGFKGGETNLRAMVQGGEGFSKLSGELKFEFTYYKKSRIELRGFGGTFLQYDATSAIARSAQFRPFAWRGSDDYTYEGLFIGRNETSGFWSQQVWVREGGLLLRWSQSPQPLSSQTLFSGGSKIALPYLKFLKLYGNVVTYPSLTSDFTTLSGNALYDVGLEVQVLKDVLSFYFPISATPYLWDTINGESYWKAVSFQLNLFNLEAIDWSHKLTRVKLM